MPEARRKLRIRNKLGLHARAAVKFVQLAAKFKCEVKVAKIGRDGGVDDATEVNGKSIMGLLTLVAAHGMEIEVTTVGADAEDAATALGALVDRGFDEGVEDV